MNELKKMTLEEYNTLKRNESVNNKKKVYFTEAQIQYIKEKQESTGELLMEGSRDNLLLPYLEILQKRGQQVTLSELKNYLMKKFVTEGNIHALSLNSNFYLSGVARYYFNGDLTFNKRLNIFYPNVQDRFIPEICQRLDEIIVYLRNAYIDAVGAKFEQPEDFGALSIAQLFKKYSGRIDKLKNKLDKSKQSKNLVDMSSNVGKNYNFEIMYSHEDCKKYNQATSPGAWCITYARKHYQGYTGSRNHFIIFYKNGYENIPRQMGKTFPLDEYGLSLLAVRQDNHDGHFVGCTTRWNHGAQDSRSVPNADNAVSYEQLKQVTGLTDEQFQQIWQTWAENKKRLRGTNTSRAEANADKLDAIRKFKQVEIMIRNGATLRQLYDNKLISGGTILYPENIPSEQNKGKAPVDYIKPSKFVIAIETTTNMVDENGNYNEYVTILDRGVVKADEIMLLNGKITLPKNSYTYYGNFRNSENIPETIAVCCQPNKNRNALYDMQTHKLIDISGVKWFTQLKDIPNTSMGVLYNKGEHEAVIYDFERKTPVQVGGQTVFENILTPHDNYNASDNLYLCMYDSAANEVYFYNSLLGKTSEALKTIKTPISRLSAIENGLSLIDFVSSTGGFYMHKIYNANTDNFVTVNGMTTFDSASSLTKDWLHLEDKIINTNTFEPLRYPDGSVVIAKRHVFHKTTPVITNFAGYNPCNKNQNYDYLEIIIDYDKRIYSLYDLKTNQFYINQDGTPFFKYYGSGQVYDSNGQIVKLPADANGTYWYQKQEMNESKNYDAAERDYYWVTGESLSDYVHVIDEVIEETQNSFGTDKTLTKESLDELCSDAELTDVMDSFEVQDTLNDKIWDDDSRLNPRVRMRLLEIADKFVDTLETNWVRPSDVIFTGSLCNYNWSKYSDIDLHVIMDFNEVDSRTEFVKDYFDAKKRAWNDEHEELRIYGFPVELYVQDENEEHTASGMYSLYKDEWIVQPSQDVFNPDNIDRKMIASKVMKYADKIDKLEDACNNETDEHKIESLGEKVKALFNKLKGIRKESLKQGGELSSGNILYKALRRLGYLGKLLELRAKTYDKIASI